jgi:hypothetical protein
VTPNAATVALRIGHAAARWLKHRATSVEIRKPVIRPQI